jgi:hypothetical protein
MNSLLNRHSSTQGENGVYVTTISDSAQAMFKKLFHSFFSAFISDSAQALFEKSCGTGVPKVMKESHAM